MKKRSIIGGSMISAIIILLASFTSAVGKDNATKNSPLYGVKVRETVRSGNILTIKTTYIGKGDKVSIPFPSPIYNVWDYVDKIVKLIKEQPSLLDKGLRYLFDNHKIMNFLKKNGIKEIQLESLKNKIKNNPDSLKTAIAQTLKTSPNMALILEKFKFLYQTNSDTSNLKCIVSALLMAILLPILLPLLIVIPIVIVVCTLTIVTCLDPSFQDLMKLLDDILKSIEGCEMVGSYSS